LTQALDASRRSRRVDRIQRHLRGAIAAGVAFHMFENNADIQIAMKTAVVLFLFGVFTFTIAYAALFVATEDIHHSMHKQGGNVAEVFILGTDEKRRGI
jgi:hypothetical protein